MFSIFLLIATALFLYGSSAKPHSSWAKVEEDQFQRTLTSQELSRKMSVGLKEVEPPEELAVTDDDIDPEMAIWKAAQWSRGQKHLASEQDRDDLYHPSLEHVPEAGANAGPREVVWNNPPIQPYQRAEPDRDDEFHGLPGSQAREPEPDRDQVHRRYIPDQRSAIEPQPRHLVYTHPEEDRDEVYHGNIPDQRPHRQPQVQPEPLSHMTHTQPEEDRDHLYHNY
ncbi:hypothetical protein SKAU_G00424510 [Synaphobranchus kaupii]|uniref:Uncharacterized protein n=1 Tax=Synaphobranchus kaupii TaxID=118154 RepID=A0A9Q1E5J7_SYNKA|nr:hypothetical protein SKAU_G00424510 [Synaphobranchus kaupii]